MHVICDTSAGVTAEEFQESRLFKDWLGQFSLDWKILSVAVHRALYFNEAYRMAFATVEAVDPDGHKQTTVIFLRGATVDILPILEAPDGSEYVPLIEQYRVPAGQKVRSTPAGMVDNGDVRMTVLLELFQELGIDIEWDEVHCANTDIGGSEAPWLVSPGGTDEVVTFYHVRAKLDLATIQLLHGTLTGAAHENERIKLHIVPLDEALDHLTRCGRTDMKAVLNLLLYKHRKQSIHWSVRALSMAVRLLTRLSRKRG